jgi:hypothetical protein
MSFQISELMLQLSEAGGPTVLCIPGHTKAVAGDICVPGHTKVAANSGAPMGDGLDAVRQQLRAAMATV